MHRFAVALSCLLLATPTVAQDVAVLTPSGDPAPIRSVKLITAGGEATKNERVFFGQVAALETVDLSFEVGGKLIMFAAQEGQFLEQGVQIAALDLDPFERALERAMLEVQQAERTLKRAKTLAQSNTVSEAQMENSETARDLAAVAVRDARDALEDAKLHAPFKALVASRLTPNFANVSPGQPIVRLHDMSEVRVEIDVPERLFQNLGNVTGITFEGSSPLFARNVPLELREFNAETQNIGQSYRVTLALPTADVPQGIIPGASMTVTARFGSQGDTGVVLPPSAVSYLGDQPRVMVYTPDADADTGTVNWVDVTVASNTGTDITVTGLDPADTLVAAGAQMLQDGETVRPFVGLTVE